MRDSNPSWQKILAEGFKSAADLLAYLQLPTQLGDVVAEKQFKTRVPRGFAEKMRPGNPNDPLLLQVLAIGEENEHVDAFVTDPLEELKANPVSGLIHKYQGRVLLTLTGACAVHCRYCFRRHFPYHENNPGSKGWQMAVDYIAADFNISERRLSGLKSKTFA